MGRDRDGVLGGPVGVSAALSGTHANHAIGLNDCYLSMTVKVEKDVPSPAVELLWMPGVGIYFYYHNTGGVGIYSAAMGGKLIACPSLWGRIVQLDFFLDRSDLMYIYIDGTYLGSISIAVGVAENLTATTINMGGRYTAENRTTFIEQARLFVINPANFPTRPQMDAIALERYTDPDVESKTLKDRPTYAVERRVDIPLVDDDQDATTVVNWGTGAATFTIGSGKIFKEVRTQAERSIITSPSEDWYCFDITHNASATADISCVQGSYIAELVYKDIDYHIGLSAARLFYMFNAGAAERLYFDITSPAYSLICTTNSVPYVNNMQLAGASKYGIQELNVMHYVYDATANLFRPVVNGQFLHSSAVAADLNLSGNVSIQYGISTRIDGLLALRLWNVAGAPSTDYAEIIKRRVLNPWNALENTFTGMVLRANYEMKMDAIQPGSSTIVRNRANLGVCDLGISGGATFASSTVKVISGT